LLLQYQGRFIEIDFHIQLCKNLFLFSSR